MEDKTILFTFRHNKFGTEFVTAKGKSEAWIKLAEQIDSDESVLEYEIMGGIE